MIIVFWFDRLYILVQSSFDMLILNSLGMVHMVHMVHNTVILVSVLSIFICLLLDISKFTLLSV
jgi:hypothetical protein